MTGLGHVYICTCIFVIGYQTHNTVGVGSDNGLEINIIGSICHVI